MGNVRILPESLSNKIAAGEVVERPASVVKELIENSLDAKSTKILIAIENGGRSLIQVSDNGMGMNHDDALLCIERYATSKIKDESDLFSIRTLGFRGEAIPSIASVSKFSLTTKDHESETGVSIRIEGGKLSNVSEVGAPVGTLISVRQLFFNTPARRKFLKTIQTEMAHISDTVASIALGFSHVQFKLEHNHKLVKSWAKTGHPIERVIDVIGHIAAEDLVPVNVDQIDLKITGWISLPHVSRSSSRGTYLYVNGRYIRDKSILHALMDGYQERLLKRQFPVAVLFIELPADQVDVNVHPAKHEVRFADQKRIFKTIASAVKDVLTIAERPIWQPASKPVETKVAQPKPPSYFTPAILKNRPTQPIDEPITDHFSRPTPKFEDTAVPLSGTNMETDNTLESKPIPQKIPEPESIPQPENSKPEPLVFETQSPQKALWQKKTFSDLRYIGQLKNTYLVFESETGMILLDQHAAHERILFEKLKHASGQHSQASQRLLIPETIDLGFEEANVMEELIPQLEMIGFEIEPFGGKTFVIKAVPSLIETNEVKALILELCEKILEKGAVTDTRKAMDESLKIIACHGAIRANQSLSPHQIPKLLEQLDRCENASHCPHGRPTWIRWSIRELEKRFQRIV